MLFNSWDFLIFFVVVYAVYTILEWWPTAWGFRRRPRGRVIAQNGVLLVASYIFYGWWDWRFLSLLAISTIVDYVAALRIDRAHAAGDARRAKRWLRVSLGTNLGILGVFKYLGFFVESTQTLLESIGLGAHLPILRIVLPVGISFYTFQTLAYTIDVYRRRMTPERSLLVFGLYVCFFPQLVAGPIERAQTLLPQLRGDRKVTYDRLATGALLIFLGLVRKVGIADRVAPVVDDVFSRSGSASAVDLLTGVLLFALQIYGDFAGYSAIARGTARLMGIELMENFRLPYFATNITIFWRRWHISLSTWLRDYLYIPLGGNRGNRWFVYRNLMLTMLLGGLWHGAAWTFVIWGAIHGVALVVHKVWTRDAKIRDTPAQVERLRHLPTAIAGWFLTMFVVLAAWVFFRAASLREASTILARIASWEGSYDFDMTRVPFDWGPLELALATGAWMLWIDLPIARRGEQTAMLRWPWPLRAITYALFVLLMLVGEARDAPFIYFQF